MRLTSKLKGIKPEKTCPICMGVRDKINNLLEVGSTISAITPEGVTAVESSNEWFPTDLE
jgi:hypothetical protein